MNVATAIQPEGANTAWDDATRAVNGWRGEALQHFARAEILVSETLVLLSQIEGRGTAIKLRHLVGQRLQDLETALDAGGPFAVEGASALVALVAFRKHEKARNMLCHGSATVTLDRYRRWTVILRVLAFRGRRPTREIQTYDEREARVWLEELKQDFNQLCSALNKLKQGLAG